MRRFVGTRVVGDVQPKMRRVEVGMLVVYTETFPVLDGGIFYYPHRGYSIFTPRGELVKRVRNHRGRNDERPTRVELAPGSYLVRIEGPLGKKAEVLVTIEAGKLTEFNVEKLLESR